MICDISETNLRMPVRVHPIFALILCGNLVEVATLIASDRNSIKARKSDSKNSSPLHWAVRHKKKNISKKLLESAADVDNRMLYTTGATPLHLACQTGDYDSVVSILSYGPSVAFNKNGLSALHVAAYKNHDKIVEVMVQEHG